MNTVTGWGCEWCLQKVVEEGRAFKEIRNPLPGPKSKSAVCGCFLMSFSFIVM